MSKEKKKRKVNATERKRERKKRRKKNKIAFVVHTALTHSLPSIHPPRAKPMREKGPRRETRKTTQNGGKGDVRGRQTGRWTLDDTCDFCEGD